MNKSPQSTVHSPQLVNLSSSRSSSTLLPSYEGRGARGKWLIRSVPVIVFLLTIAAFTSAFFPHADALSTPALLDLVQRCNIDNLSAEMMTTIRISSPKDPQAFVTNISSRLGCDDPLIISASKETRLTASSRQDYTLSIRLHPINSLWGNQAELQISLVSVHPGILADIERQLREIIHQLRPGDKIPVLTTISGTLPPERIERTQKEFIAKAFASLKAEIREGLSEENLESWSGHSTRLPDVIEVGRNKLNLQIATRYAHSENIVIIKIGTPLIIGTY